MTAFRIEKSFVLPLLPKFWAVLISAQTFDFVIETSSTGVRSESGSGGCPQQWLQKHIQEPNVKEPSARTRWTNNRMVGTPGATSPYLSPAFDVRLWQVSWQCQRHRLTALLWHYGAIYEYINASECVCRLAFAEVNPRLLRLIAQMALNSWPEAIQAVAMG